MIKILAVVALVGVACVCGIKESEGNTDNIAVKVVTKDELSTLLRSFPNSVPLRRSEQRKALDVSGSSRDIVLYTIGQRQRGDQRVAFKQHSNSWSEPNDVRLELDYPDVGIGALISYVQVVVEQSNSAGEAYVIRGGVGQRFVKIALVAVNTHHFSYEASVFGVD